MEFIEEVLEKLFEMGPLSNSLFNIIFLISIIIAAILTMQPIHVNAAEGLFIYVI